MSYDNTDTFVLFKNDKGDNPKRPDYTGTINIDGTDYKLAAWIRDGKKGKFMTGKIGDPVEEREERQSNQRSQQQGKPAARSGYEAVDNDPFDDAPF